MIAVVMGVSGVGKTTAGVQLADSLEIRFFDADDYHPAENIAKMSAGEPLNDLDRAPWLDKLGDLILKHGESNRPMVLACSALKRAYRDRLRTHPAVRFFFLDASYDSIVARIEARAGHFMKRGMLESQFATLEYPSNDESDLFLIDANLSPAEILNEMRSRLLAE